MISEGLPYNFIFHLSFGFPNTTFEPLARGQHRLLKVKFFSLKMIWRKPFLERRPWTPYEWILLMKKNFEIYEIAMNNNGIHGRVHFQLYLLNHIWAEHQIYNQFHNILRLFDISLTFPFTISEMMSDYYW